MYILNVIKDHECIDILLKEYIGFNKYLLGHLLHSFFFIALFSLEGFEKSLGDMPHPPPL